MKQVAVCDIDGVLIKEQTQFLFLKYLFSQRKISFLSLIKIGSWFILYRFNLVSDTESIRSQAYLLLKGWQIEAFRELCRTFVLEEIQPEIVIEVKNRIQQLYNDGYEIFFVSATLRDIAVAIRDLIGFGDVVATRLEIVGGLLTGKIEGKAVYGDEKLSLVDNLIGHRGLTWSGSYVIADHISDLPLLNKAENAVVVNPDQALRILAIRNKWEVL